MSKLGRKIVYHLIHFDEGLEKLNEKNITEDHFMFEAKDAFKYTRDKILGGRVPTLSEIQDTFKIKLETCVAGDIEYLTDKMRKRYVSTLINPHIEEAIQALDIEDPETAIKLLTEVGEYRRFLLDSKGGHSFKENAEDRFEHYLEAKAKKGITGIPSMWKEINESCGGYVDGQFYVLAAFTNVGKTWALCITGDDISSKIDKDECLLIISTEMQAWRIGRRLDAVKHKLNFKEMRKGLLEEADEDEWMEYIDQATHNTVDYGDLQIEDEDCHCVEDILLKVKEYNPKAVLIDGGYRLKPSRQGKYDAHSKQVTVIREIQQAVISTDIPWIVTAQVGEVDEKKKGRQGNTYQGMKYAKEWMIDPDNVFLLRQTEDHKDEDKMVWTNAKLRDGEDVGKDWQTHWNPKTMTYDDLDDDETVYKPAGTGTATFKPHEADPTEEVPPVPEAKDIMP